MLFNSIDFLLFLPVVFLLYQACHTARSQNALIVVASYIFYGWWDARFLLLIAVTTVCSYASGIAMERWDSRDGARSAALVASIVVNLGILALFKYYNFFVSSLAGLLGMAGISLDWATLNVVLPVGISFYTFQALSYTIDVYRRDVPAEHDTVAFFAFISFFPQLVAGPIERAGNLLPQFASRRRFDYAGAVDGMRQMLWGFFKKLVIADKCAETVDTIFANSEMWNSPTLLYGLLLFAFQIYADFSGYSDIAIGTARLFGVRLMRNFNNPFFSVSVADLWRRWHISLMSWFRDYVYFPLGGSRRGKARKVLNTCAVFVLSGLWHGANWNYVAWGAYNALLLVPRALSGKREKALEAMGYAERLARRIGVFALFLVGVAIFRTQSLADAWHFFGRLLTGGVAGGIMVIDHVVCFSIAAMMVVEWLQRGRQHALQIDGVVRSTALRVLIYYAIAAMIFWQGGHATQFIYFQF